MKKHEKKKKLVKVYEMVLREQKDKKEHYTLDDPEGIEYLKKHWGGDPIDIDEIYGGEFGSQVVYVYDVDVVYVNGKLSCATIYGVWRSMCCNDERWDCDICYFGPVVIDDFGVKAWYVYSYYDYPQLDKFKTLMRDNSFKKFMEDTFKEQYKHDKDFLKNYLSVLKRKGYVVIKKR